MRTVKRIFAVFFLLFLIGATWFGIMFVGEMRHASELLTTLPDKLRHYSVEPSKIVSRDKQVLWTIQSEFREPITYEQIPKHVRDAMVAAEDKRFYEHSGVDYWAMGRILLVGAREGRLSQGGSTLTMQLAKKFYSEGERTFSRKLQDVALAITMERDMTKEQILTLYLNTMYFGSKAYGIQAASEVYFGKKDLNKLTIAECAMLARCVRRPSDENPFKNLQKSIDNRNTVLGIMRDEHMITNDEYQEAIAEKPKLSPPKERITSHLNKAPYFVDHVLQTVEQELPDLDLKQGGYTIETTIDTKMQDYAEKQVAAFVKAHRGGGVNQAAFVLMDKDGKILAEVGGLNYGKSQFNIVTQGQLQPGSSFKPFLYATAFSEGRLSMSDSLENEPFTYGGTESWGKPWVVHNSSPRENSGPVGVERALALSLNIPAAHVMERVGPSEVVAFATGIFGFHSKLEAVPSLALGTSLITPLEMAQGYSVFMLHGDRAKPYCITRVTGPDGEVVVSHDPQITKGVLDPRIADDIEILLKDVCEWGTGSAVGGVVPNARGKTGTTSSHKDIWFCGYTDGLVGIAWAGNNTIRNGKVYQLPMGSSMWGATAASDLWAAVMKKAHDRFASPVQEAPKPVEVEPTHNRRDQDPGDTVKIIPPDENVPNDGTTGGDGRRPVPPDNGGTATTGGDTTGGTATTGGDTAGNPPPPTTDPGTAPPTRPDPRRGRRNEPPPDEGDTVQVEVCAETGMKATIYCPETVTRTFRRGHEPKRRCTLHGG